ncbi:hypothetical protein IQ06DRAFT_32027 [Phaeosphaeriaceae sp. SRC1lsM3a]|nr:hypothetical protein IQ06DRAFT_32027 [Stagonospora sp. SRC1lsM3a]
MDESLLPLMYDSDWPVFASRATANQKKRRRGEYEDNHEMMRMDGPSSKRASASPPAERKDSKQEAAIFIKDFATAGPSRHGAGDTNAWVQSLTAALQNAIDDDDNKSDESLETVKPIKEFELDRASPRILDGDMNPNASNDSLSTVKPLRKDVPEGTTSQRYGTSLLPSDSASQSAPTISSKGKQRGPIPTTPAQPSYRKVPFVNPHSPVSSKPPSRLSRHSYSNPPPNIITTPPSPPARLDMTAIRATMAEHQANIRAADALRAPGRQRQHEIEQMSA